MENIEDALKDRGIRDIVLTTNDITGTTIYFSDGAYIRYNNNQYGPIGELQDKVTKFNYMVDELKKVGCGLNAFSVTKPKDVEYVTEIYNLLKDRFK